MIRRTGRFTRRSPRASRPWVAAPWRWSPLPGKSRCSRSALEAGATSWVCSFWQCCRPDLYETSPRSGASPGRGGGLLGYLVPAAAERPFPVADCPHLECGRGLGLDRTPPLPAPAAVGGGVPVRRRAGRVSRSWRWNDATINWPWPWRSRAEEAYLARSEPTWKAAQVSNLVFGPEDHLLTQDYRAFYFDCRVTRESIYRRRGPIRPLDHRSDRFQPQVDRRRFHPRASGREPQRPGDRIRSHPQPVGRRPVGQRCLRLAHATRRVPFPRCRRRPATLSAGDAAAVNGGCDATGATPG